MARRRTKAARDHARDVAARAILVEWQRLGTGAAGPTRRDVERLLDAVAAAGVQLTRARPLTPYHWPSQIRLDPAATGALDRLAGVVVELNDELAVQEQATAAGPGITEAIIGARLADPVPSRLSWPHSADLHAGRLKDRQREVDRLRALHRDVCHHIDNEAAWLVGAIWPQGRTEEVRR
jgi:hypothetical protein